MTLFSYLEALLPAPPAKTLLVGWRTALDQPAREELAHGPGEILHATTCREIVSSAKGLDAILWVDSDPHQSVEATIEALSQHLKEGGRLIVAVQQAAETIATRQRGSLPTQHQPRVRNVVRVLSESGFAIRKDQDLGSQEIEAEGWKVLVTRRDRFRIRSYEDGDVQAILHLFLASFHLERSVDHWRWKYFTNPFGPGRVSLGFATSHEAKPSGGDSAANSDLAAHYGGYPIPIWRQNKRGPNQFTALQVGDTMIDPAFRDVGRGKASLLARTVRHFFSVHRDGSLGFYFGFNTGPIQRFCRWFIGGSQTIPVHYRVRELDTELGPARGGYRVRRIEAVGPAWDRLFRRTAPSYRFLVRRDARYLEWRYLNCPETRFVMLAAFRWGRLVGWSVFRRHENHLIWGDALFDKRHACAARSILATALDQPDLDSVQRIVGWFPEEPSWWHQELGELGFVDRPEPEGLGMVALPDAEPEAFEDLAKLYYTMGDGDLF